MDALPQWLNAATPLFLVVLWLVVKIANAFTPDWKYWPKILKPLGMIVQALAGQMLRPNGAAPVVELTPEPEPKTDGDK